MKRGRGGNRGGAVATGCRGAARSILQLNIDTVHWGARMPASLWELNGRMLRWGGATLVGIYV